MRASTSVAESAAVSVALGGAMSGTLTCAYSPGNHRGGCMDADLAFTSALDQAEMIRHGEVSPGELVEGYLERIERLDPQLDSYLTVAADQARAAASDAEKRLARGDVDDAPFLGVPISIKDLADTAGIRTTHGTATYADRIPDVDDEVVARIRRAGFVILGKTNTPEFGSRSTTESPAYPTARNPWDTNRTPGGSSGGAGAGLAAGLSAIAHGSDGGGSIRIPAAWCGLVGLKPSRGRVSWAPGPQSANATNGPLAAHRRRCGGVPRCHRRLRDRRLLVGAPARRHLPRGDHPVPESPADRLHDAPPDARPECRRRVARRGAHDRATARRARPRRRGGRAAGLRRGEHRDHPGGRARRRSEPPSGRQPRLPEPNPRADRRLGNRQRPRRRAGGAADTRRVATSRSSTTTTSSSRRRSRPDPR